MTVGSALPGLWSVQPVASPRRRAYGVAWLVLVLAMGVVLVFRNGNTPDLAIPPVLVGFAVLSVLPLLALRRRPREALLGAVLAESLRIASVPLIAPEVEPVLAISVLQPAPLATMVAAWTVASRMRSGWLWGVAAGVVLFGVGVLTRPGELILTVLAMFNVVLLAAAAGAVVTARRERRERSRLALEADVQVQVAQERSRIARDLHDVLAHHLALVNAQAGVAAYLVRTDPVTAARALEDIAGHTRKALDGLRATVGLLRRAEPQPGEEDRLRPLPGYDRVEELVAAVGSSGARVRMGVHGRPGPLDAAADVAVYRIVQEALTNATKHAPGAEVEVALTWHEQELEVRVENGPAPVRPAVRAPGTGHGLIGMRERASASDGRLEAGPTAGGGFRVRADIPLGSASGHPHPPHDRKIGAP